MIELSVEQVERWVRAAFGPDARLADVGDLGALDKQGMKRFGYGKPVLVRFTVGGQAREGVLSVMKGDAYGHQFWWDRAAVLMFQFDASGRLPRHARPLALGYVDAAGELVPVAEPREFFIVNEKIPGHDYFHDLDRIRKGGFKHSDLILARKLAAWLADIHAAKKDEPRLYSRRIRELVGGSECIMGLEDEAFPHPYAAFPDERFVALEKRLVDWRWRLKTYAHRLCVVHGDFHPWNVLVTDDGDFGVLDRSRGEFGEPADDVATMAVNYFLFGLYDHPRLTGPFERLYLAFFEEYLERTGDTGLLRVIAPFLVFRCLVIASPQWYPDHPERVRRGLFALMENVLEEERFDYARISRYMEG